jgi:hypothetical protein
LITRAARRFPASVRFTCADAADEAGELRLGTAVGSPGGNTSPGGWGESKLDGISEHVAGGFVGGAHQRVLNRVAARGLDHQTAGEQIALGHFRKGCFGGDPPRVSLAVGGQWVLVDECQQPQVIKAGGDAPPLLLGDRHQKRGRLGNVDRGLIVGLTLRPQRLVPRITAQHLQMRRDRLAATHHTVSVSATAGLARCAAAAANGRPSACVFCQLSTMTSTEAGEDDLAMSNRCRVGKDL